MRTWLEEHEARAREDRAAEREAECQKAIQQCLRIAEVGGAWESVASDLVDRGNRPTRSRLRPQPFEAGEYFRLRTRYRPGNGVQTATTTPLRVDVPSTTRKQSSCCTCVMGCATALVENVIPEFQGFKDDPATCASAVNTVAGKDLWPDHMKKSFAEGRI
ncbi:hypothetical protein HPB50_004672 [Hyalomma asiaticum]|uniref:Uncharacterized protein n=1 Tax=Hyalomma asiaticum TaxID=266040 RepID=A0ACB7RHD4_HYAAI|nr:hypothetical protein HPB50_004672 [Hyalomma asiaticum]